jgi:hypothetical protein
MRLRPSSSVALLSVGSPLVLIVLGLVGVSGGGWKTPGGVLLVIGLMLAAVVAWDMPLRTDLDAAGVHRRSLVRLRHFEWDEVVAFERGGRRSSGALVLRTVAGKRVALCDAPERPDQWDALRLLVADHAPGVAVPDAPKGHPFRGRTSS